MLAALLRLRLATALVALTLAVLFAAAGSAQTIDLKLNVIYTNPSNAASGGMWQLIAKTETTGPPDFGIAGVVARIANINADAVLQGPHGTVNGANTAGFQLLGDVTHAASGQTPAFHELTLAQLPLQPLPSGSEETYFYGVGTIKNGSPAPGPNSIGPTFISLTNPQGIPWATGDLFGDPSWDTGARLASGTFAAGVSPVFVAGSTGEVFSSLPATNSQLGNIVLVPGFGTTVHTNLVMNSADYNHNGIVDAADYVLWRKQNGSAAVPPGSGADGNGDGTVDILDYNLWRSHYGNPSGSGSGGGLSSNNIPEPTGCILLAIGALLAIAPRRGRFQLQVNN
jgi:hypothetical protein